jgi:hypothetical protein
MDINVFTRQMTIYYQMRWISLNTPPPQPLPQNLGEGLWEKDLYVSGLFQ